MGPARKPRADGRRNRERLVEAAKAAFAELGVDVSLDEIARRTGVGIGTLYRHFPTRDAIVAAVYRREVEQLAGAAERLLGSLSPGAALHEWMRLFVDYIATKKVIASALKLDRRQHNRALCVLGRKDHWCDVPAGGTGSCQRRHPPGRRSD